MKFTVSGIYIFVKNKISRFFLRIVWFLKRNFLDVKNRIDVTRIGQVFGLGFLAILTWVGVVWFIQGKYQQLEMLTVLMGESAAPMLLYRLKEWAGKNGSAFEYPELITGRYAKGFRKWLRDNLTDGKGRVDTGRIGNIQGALAIIVIVSWSIYKIVFKLEPVPEKHLLIVGGSGSFAMLMYRMKDIFERALASKKEEETSEGE